LCKGRDDRTLCEGTNVTYDQSPHGHIRTEFAFDVEQATRKAFAPPAYLEFIGFKAPRKFLAQAFIDTYGFDIHEVLGEARPALRSYTTSARRFPPAFAEAEVVLHRHQFLPPPDDEAYRIFAERVARTNYDRRWKHTYRGPGFKAHILAFFVFIVPKVGPAADLAIKISNHDTEELYLRSVNHTVDSFPAALEKLGSEPKTLIALSNIGSYPQTGFGEMSSQPTCGTNTTRLSLARCKPHSDSGATLARFFGRDRTRSLTCNPNRRYAKRAP
jgi:hypothetical protein